VATLREEMPGVERRVEEEVRMDVREVRYAA
jgi:hypothetical protein